MKAKATRADAVNLFHEGLLALSDIERNGVRIDTVYLEKAIAEADTKSKRLAEKLYEDVIWKRWQRKYRSKAKLGNKVQLGSIIFDDLGYERKWAGTTDNDEERKDKNNEEAFSQVNLPFVKRYFRREKLLKAKNTYLEGIRNETVDGLLHCFFHLHLVKTFRGSSSDPNIQNIPVRNADIQELVRKAFIPRDGHLFIEIDYASLEVRIIACYSRDSTLIKFIEDGKDPHFEWAMRCYKLEADQVTKDIRFYAKNQFVFPEFYGSWYLDCARYLWDYISKAELTTKDGTPLCQHLKEQGIKKLGKLNPKERPVKGTFEHHIKEAEEYFRHDRYKEHTAWREREWEKYKKKGYVETLTGFRLGEVYRRNQIINSPIQGSGFHCLLWSLVQLNRWLKKNKMRSKIVNTIHDCILIDTHPKERDAVIQQAIEFSTKTIRKDPMFHWIIVPMEVEVEQCDVGTSWFDKKRVI